MLVETLRADWTARGTNARVSALPEFDDGALKLGAGTKISEARGDRRDAAADGERAVALVSVAIGRPLDASAATHVRRALAKAREGDAPLALTHLALAGAGRLTEPREDARRLFIADGLMEAGVSPRTILAALGAPPAPAELDRAYNPDQPRVPAGSGRPSGQWTTGDDAGEPSADSGGGPERPSEGEASPNHPTQIADSSDDWAQYLNPVGTAEAAEVPKPPFNGSGPNSQHDKGVAKAIAWYRAHGYTIVSEGPFAVNVPGFPTARIYDFGVRDPIGKLWGAEIKTTKFSTIFLNPIQVLKDVVLYATNGGYAPSLGIGNLMTGVMYVTYCVDCDAIDLRPFYLKTLLELVKIRVYTEHDDIP